MDVCQESMPHLTLRYQLGDGNVVGEVLTRLEPLICYLAARWLPSLPDQEAGDLEQEARLSVLRALSTWASGSAGLETYCSRLINRRLAALYRDSRRAKRGGGQPARSLSEPVGRDAETGELLLLGDTLVGGTDPAELALHQLMLESLPAPLRDVAQRLADGENTSEIADILHLPYHAIRTLKSGIRAQLEEWE